MSPTETPTQSYDSIYGECIAPLRATLTERRGYLDAWISSMTADIAALETRLRAARTEFQVVDAALMNLANAFETPPANINLLPPHMPMLGTGASLDAYSKSLIGASAGNVKRSF